MLTPPKSTATPFRRTVTTLPRAAAARTPRANRLRHEAPAAARTARQRVAVRVRREAALAEHRRPPARRRPTRTAARTPARRSAGARRRLSSVTSVLSEIGSAAESRGARSRAARRARGRRSSRRSLPRPSRRRGRGLIDRRNDGGRLLQLYQTPQYHGMVRVKWSRAPSHGSSFARRATIDLQLGDFDSVHGDVVPPPPRPRLLDGHARAARAPQRPRGPPAPG